MAAFRCKMCGGVIDHQPGDTVGVCGDCRSVQTLPKNGSEERLGLYEKAHYARRNRAAGKALRAYDRLIASDRTDPEAYWGRVLTRYGVHYKQNPADFSRSLRIRKGAFRDLSKDPDLQKVLEYADERQKPVYEQEAEAIRKRQRRKKAIDEWIMAAVLLLIVTAVALSLIIPANNRRKAYARFAPLFEGLEAGDRFTYGTFEQDGLSSNGAEPIEWVVLEKQKDRMLVISLYGLERREFHHIDIPVTWRTCTARRWLNNTFYREAFDDEERSLIRRTSILTDKSLDKLQGTYTRDRIFPLNRHELKDYMPEELWACVPTPYAVANGAHTDPETGNCRWWLRSPGMFVYNTATVDEKGQLSLQGRAINSATTVLRPAMWIAIEPNDGRQKK